MDINQLRYVVELTKQNSFSRAADVLYITQPALSQQISRLEQELGFKIFNRTTRQIALTPFGKEFVARAQTVVEAFDQLQQFSLNAAKSIKSVIRFGASTNSGTYVNSCLSFLASEFPNAVLKYEESWDINLIHMLEERKIDIALILMSEEQLKTKQLSMQVLYSDYICALISRDDKLAEKPSVSLDELRSRNMIFSSPHSTLMHVLMEHVPNRDSILNMVSYITKREAQFPLINNGAVGVALYKQKKQALSPYVACIPIEPRISLSYVIACTQEYDLIVNRKKIMQSIIDMLSADLRENAVPDK